MLAGFMDDMPQGAATVAPTSPMMLGIRQAWEELDYQARKAHAAEITLRSAASSPSRQRAAVAAMMAMR